MPREQYDLDEDTYQSRRKEQHEKIDNEFSNREKENDLKERIVEAERNKNFKLKQRTYGTTEEEIKNKARAEELRRQKRKEVLEREIASRKQKMDELVETQVFGKKWGRLEARELAYGAQEPEVVRLKELKQQENKRLEAEREKYQRPSLENPHQLETLKGKYTEHFNDKDRTR